MHNFFRGSPPNSFPSFMIPAISMLFYSFNLTNKHIIQKKHSIIRETLFSLAKKTWGIGQKQRPESEVSLLRFRLRFARLLMQMQKQTIILGIAFAFAFSLLVRVEIRWRWLNEWMRTKWRRRCDHEREDARMKGKICPWRGRCPLCENDMSCRLLNLFCV